VKRGGIVKNRFFGLHAGDHELNNTPERGLVTMIAPFPPQGDVGGSVAQHLSPYRIMCYIFSPFRIR